MNSESPTSNCPQRGACPCSGVCHTCDTPQCDDCTNDRRERYNSERYQRFHAAITDTTYPTAADAAMAVADAEQAPLQRKYNAAQRLLDQEFAKNTRLCDNGATLAQMLKNAGDEVDRLRAELDTTNKIAWQNLYSMRTLSATIERVRAVLDTWDGMDAAPGFVDDIRAALNGDS